MKITIPACVTRTVVKVATVTKAYSPEILLGAGLICVGTAFGLAIHETTKVTKVLEESTEELKTFDNQVAEVKEKIEAGVIAPEKYTPEMEKRDRTSLTIRTGVKVAKTYIPAVTTLGLGVACILVSHRILNARYVGMAAAYKTLETTYTNYRKRVVADQGQDKDFYYATGMKKVESCKIETDDGSVDADIYEKDPEIQDTADQPELRDGWQLFDSCTAPSTYEKNPNDNICFLKRVERDCNNELFRYGRLTLNHVYKAIGLPETWYGATHGWAIDKDEKHGGQNYISFGIEEAVKNGLSIEERRQAFLNGFEPVILLRFNYDTEPLKWAYPEA